VREPLARLLMCTRRVTLRCAGRWPACCWARAGLRLDARASSSPVVGHAQGYTQVREPLARLLMCTRKVTLRCAGRWPACCCARAGLRLDARASSSPVVGHAQGYTQVREPLARLLMCTRKVTLRCAGRWPACCCARAGLRSGARAAGSPFNVRAQGYAQVREPLARPLICARRCAGRWLAC
jgi:hypothetical protein